MHHPPPTPRSFATLWRRIAAAGMAGMVVVLTLLSASPAAHAWLHPHDAAAAPHADAGGARAPQVEATAEETHAGCTHDHASENPEHADHRCAIVLLSQGTSLPLAMPAITAPEIIWCAALTPAQVELFLRTPRYLRHPERGPPVVG